MKQIKMIAEETRKTKAGKISKNDIKKNIGYFCKLAKKRIESLDFDKKKELLNIVIDKIKLNTSNKKVKIIMIIPLLRGFEASSSDSRGLLSLTSYYLALQDRVKPYWLDPWFLFCPNPH